jgi:FMN phosphatase YigB (HAD superfamily)
VTRLACFDLDNTLIDRDAAFRAWAESFCAQNDLGADDLEWFLSMDSGGYLPRPDLFLGARERFGLPASAEELVAAYDVEHPLFTWCEPEVFDGLAALRSAGWRVVVVTNGGTIQQTAKLEHTGLGAVVDYSCISESEGVGKPDRRIFEIAAERTGANLPGGWMAGDHLAFDVAGGKAAGLSTILVGDLNETTANVRPDLHLASVLEAFPVILAS